MNVGKEDALMDSSQEKTLPNRMKNDDSLLIFDDFHESPNYQCTTPVTTISINTGPTRDDVVRKFTLNRNQKAAFMIITGHLDGLDSMDKGRVT